MTHPFTFLAIYTGGWLLFAWGTFFVVEWRARSQKKKAATPGRGGK